MSTAGGILIYGATGYTGELIARAALERGLRPVLAGRNTAKLEALAASLQLEPRSASLERPPELHAALRDMAVLVNAAGPFAATAQPMLDACLRGGVHYLDLCAEVGVIEALHARGAEAQQRGIMLMPAVGFDVVPSDCLAAHVARGLRGARALRIGISGLGLTSRGSAHTLVEQVGQRIWRRRGGALETVEPGALSREFDYGAGARKSEAVSWADVATAFYTTGIPDIEVYFESTPLLQAMLLVKRAAGSLLASAPSRALLHAQLDWLPAGPPASERGRRRAVLVAEAEDGRGRRCAARLVTPEAYTLSAATACAIAEQVARGDREPGFQTPARVYGPDWILRFDGVAREDLAR